MSRDRLGVGGPAAVVLIVLVSACRSSDGDHGQPDHSTPMVDRGGPEAACDLGTPDGAPADSGASSDSPIALTNGFVLIPAGTFGMGSPESEACRSPDEGLHRVILTRAFELGATEVTQAEFAALMGYNPSIFVSCGETCPVEQVNWHEAAAYCNALTAKHGQSPCYACTGSGPSVSCAELPAYRGDGIYLCPGYRLPTEAEWQYAYRAGTQTAYYDGPNDPAMCTSCHDAAAELIAWYDCNAGSTPHPVGQKQPNAWALYDMAGNVYEWCNDWYYSDFGPSVVTDPAGPETGSLRVLLGGAWADPALDLRAAKRNYEVPDGRSGSLGFRCSRAVP